MATPLVAGCAAVVRQFLQAQGVATPSAALVKAMLINGSKILTGQYVPPEVGAPPDNSQGFGRLDLAATVGPYAAGEIVTFHDENNALDTGGEEHTAQAVNAGQTLKATLVWTDPAGEALQNDLDLVVRTPDGQVSHGNRPAGSIDFDRSNNVEQVIVGNVAQGNVDIVVRAFRITTPQTYALVVRVS
jgi:serine protease AprX